MKHLIRKAIFQGSTQQGPIFVEAIHLGKNLAQITISKSGTQIAKITVNKEEYIHG